MTENMPNMFGIFSVILTAIRLIATDIHKGTSVGLLLFWWCYSVFWY